MYKIKANKRKEESTALKNFSRFIRLRDAINTTGTMTDARCVTCGSVLPIKDMDAGHGIPGRSNGILFDEDLVFAQCRVCNRLHSGEQQMFKHILVSKHGLEWFEMKLQARKTPTKLSDMELQVLNDSYLKRIADMKKRYEVTE